MNWENKLKATGFLSLKNKEGDTFSYIKLDDAAKIAELAYNEALDKVKEIYKDEAELRAEVAEAWDSCGDGTSLQELEDDGLFYVKSREI